MRIFVKICGLTSEAAVYAAVDAGADAIGFVLAPSPRRVTTARAAALAERVPPGVLRVLVFRHVDAGELQACRDALDFDVVQADAGAIAALEARDPAARGADFLPVHHDGVDLLERVAASTRLCVLDGPLGPGRGARADVDRAARLARQRPILLAGGLDADVVGDAIARVRPFGVDVSSGVEAIPGMKDPRRIAAFVAAVRAAETVAERRMDGSDR